MKTYSQRDVDHILEKLKNIQKQFNEVLSIQIEKLSNLEPLSNDKILNEEITCDSFIPGDGKWVSPRCRGTKEYDICYCEGDVGKCDFYPLLRQSHGILLFCSGESYYYIDDEGNISSATWADTSKDLNRRSCGNCFSKDAYNIDTVRHFEVMKLLNYRLEIYARHHHALAQKIEVEHSHTPLWWVTRNSVRSSKTDYPSVPLFNDYKVAEKALTEVVAPFLVEFPSFVW